MIAIKEICQATGISKDTFQTWRRHDSDLLPKPVAVDKKVIYFDDSIVERVRFILEQRAGGLRVGKIRELLRQRDEDEAISQYLAGLTDDRDNPVAVNEATAKLAGEWEQGYHKNEVCLALKLDPALSGSPAIFTRIYPGQYLDALWIYASIISNGQVHFAELQLAESHEIKVAQRAKMPVADFGMLVALAGDAFAKQSLILEVKTLPYILLSGQTPYYPEDEAYAAIKKRLGQNPIERAGHLAKLLRAGQAFVKFL